MSNQQTRLVPGSRVRSLERIALYFATYRDPERALSRALADLRAVLGLAALELWLQRPDGSLQRRAASGEVSLPASSAAAAAVSASGEPLLVPDLQGEQRFAGAALATSGLRSLAGVPLATVGVLCAYADVPRVFALREVRYLRHAGALLARMAANPAETQRERMFAGMNLILQDLVHSGRNVFNALGMSIEVCRRYAERGQHDKIPQLLANAASSSHRGAKLLDDISAAAAAGRRVQRVDPLQVLPAAPLFLASLGFGPERIALVLPDRGSQARVDRLGFQFLVEEYLRQLAALQPQRLSIAAGFEDGGLKIVLAAEDAACMTAAAEPQSAASSALPLVDRAVAACKASLRVLRQDRRHEIGIVFGAGSAPS